MCSTRFFRTLLIVGSSWLAASGCSALSNASRSDIDLPDASESAIAPVGLEDNASYSAEPNALNGSSGNATIDGDLGSTRSTTHSDNTPDVPGAVTERVRREREEAFNPYVLTAHKHNFILPVSYTTGINEEIYRRNDVPLRDGLQPAEVKFQISLKTQLNESDLLLKDDALSLGITLEAWWQLYSSDLSSPFRETNYQPEIFYLVPLLWGPFGGSTSLVFGFEHQSNGQVQGLSRSWNRLYTTLIYERGALVASLRPWYRIPEKAKDAPDDPEGDDNPDIIDFMGHGEMSVSWRRSNMEYAMKGRGNPVTGKGAITVGVTFPLFAKFRGFVQFFSGYGDSLIDYDHYQQRLGIGVALTNLF